MTTPVRFVGVDGEGSDESGEHRYVLLSVGNRSLHRDGAHLELEELLEFLYDCYTDDPDAVYVGFYLSYDFGQWLRTLPESKARQLLTDEGKAGRQRRPRPNGSTPPPFPVRWRRWELDMLGMRRFKLRPRVGKDEEAKPWMHICDVGSFWQTSFVKATDPSTWTDPVCTPDEHARIVAGKADRAAAALGKDMMAYNKLENRVLGRLMSSLDLGLKTMGVALSPTQWIGPGQAAKAWLASTPTITRREMAARDDLDWPRIGAQASYFGGWFEITAHGHIPGATHEYDINSAYPHIMTALPCLEHARVDDGAGTPPRSGWVLIHARVRGRDQWLGAASHRTPKGRVLRPRKTAGWFWLHELRAAKRAKLVSSFEVVHWVRLTPRCRCDPPLAGVADLYHRRLEVGKKTPAGRAYRLVYNSGYGSLAQSIGKPRYGNSIYASLITAGCRSMILDAITTHPQRSDAVAMVATDGVYFTEPHPDLDVDPGRLGAWDHTELDNLTIMMPGMYWHDGSRQALTDGGTPTMKTRGINAAALARVIGALDRQWTEFTRTRRWPSIDVPIPFSVTSPSQALHRGKWESCGAVSHTETRTLSANPRIKRDPSQIVVDDRGVVRTVPYAVADPVDSTPYDESFGRDLEVMREDDPVNPDGTAFDQIHELLGLR